MMNLSIYIYINVFAATYIIRGKLTPPISVMHEEPFDWGLIVLIVPTYSEKSTKILIIY